MLEKTGVVAPLHPKAVGLTVFAAKRMMLLPLALLAVLAAEVVVFEPVASLLAQKFLLSLTAIIVLAAAIVPKAAAASPFRTLLLPRSFTWRRSLEFLGLASLLGLLVLIVQRFEIESGAFQAKLMPLIFFGFLIHYFLPLERRKEFFLLLSLGAFAGILGVYDTAWLILIGLTLIGICFLPIQIGVRILMLIGAAVLLVVTRSGWAPAPWSGAFWTIFGSLFMFRLIVFLYDLHHSTARPKWDTTFSYFLLLPNVVFPLFPIVDFATFRRTYFNEEEHRIYLRGIKWITWGVLHLILFRLLNQHLLISPESVANAADLFFYIVPNFLLLVQISGKFYIITGILLLFGFNLPKPFRNFFLSSSFTDFWRRANLYWRAFIIKIFYYPFYFWMRGPGVMARLSLATAFAFVATWFFHSYQWYWLTGTALLTVPDITFWAAFGLLVLGNSLYETKFGRKRKLGAIRLSTRDRLSLGIRTVGVFFTIAILYSVWTSHSMGEWVSLWRTALSAPLDFRTVLYLLVAIAALGIGAQFVQREGEESTSDSPDSKGWSRQAFACGVIVLPLFLVGTPVIRSQLGAQPTEWLDSLKGSRLSEREADLLLRGYYENLTGIGHFNSELFALYAQRPDYWPLLQETEAARLTDDIVGIELIPSTRIEFHGATLSVNRWGMRGREYDLTPPPGVFRVALLGPSFVMGSGVADEEVFSAVLEERLTSPDGAFEFLNFAAPSFSALEELVVFETRSLQFSPHAVFLVAHDHEKSIVIRNLSGRIHNGADIPYPFLIEIMRKAGLTDRMTREEMERALRPFEDEVLIWVYERIVELASRDGILPVWVYIPSLEMGDPKPADPWLKEIAAQSGFLTIDLSDVYRDHPPMSLAVAPWDRHPNARAHRLIADRLHEEMMRHAEHFAGAQELRASETD